jgi:glycosyltransferase involved in cell wall biosynthesis
MRIAFDAKRIFNNATGLGNYSRIIVDNLHRFFPDNEYLLFTPSIGERTDFQKYATQFKTIQSTATFKHIWRSYSIGKDLEKENITLYHGLSNEIPFFLKNSKTVVTIHDVIFKIYPNTYPSVDRWLYEEKTRYACHNALKIITISENTKKDLITYYGVDPDQIKVIYPACNPIYYQDEPFSKLNLPANLRTLPKDFILSVGSIVERKNLLNLIKAVENLPKSIQIPIVVVGRGKQYYKQICTYIEAKNISNLIYWIDNLDSNNCLKYLYQQAQMLVYPSFYEGFGLPVVEAKLCGTPVLTSNVSSLPEAGGTYAQYANPHDVGALSAAIQALLENQLLHQELSEKGKKEARESFDPQRLSQQLMTLYQEVVEVG